MRLKAGDSIYCVPRSIVIFTGFSSTSVQHSMVTPDA